MVTLTDRLFKLININTIIKKKHCTFMVYDIKRFLYSKKSFVYLQLYFNIFLPLYLLHCFVTVIISLHI